MEHFELHALTIILASETRRYEKSTMIINLGKL
jgi:hypothetical protein